MPAATLAALILSAADAEAGTYDVWSCRAPDGSPAAVADGGGGWEFRTLFVETPGVNRLQNECASGNGLTLRHAVSDSQPAPSYSMWVFRAPAGTTLAAYELDVEAWARGAVAGQGLAQGELAIWDQTQEGPLDWSFHATGGEHGFALSRRVLRYSGNGASNAFVSAGCTGAPSDRCTAVDAAGVARTALFRSTMTLDDRDAPIVTSVSGDATLGTSWTGPTGISIGASDLGGGVYRVGVEVDGSLRAWTAAAGGSCRAWPGTERVFTSPKPCPSSVSSTQTIQTADLPEGAHTVRVIIEDAAGNQTAAYGPVTKLLSRGAAGPGGGPSAAPAVPAPGVPAPPDSGAPNGSPAVPDARLRAEWEGREASTRTIRFDQRPVLKGQLTTRTGQPIRGAAIRVGITRKARNSPPFERNSLTTDGKGRFRWKLPTGVSSRSIRLAYHQRVRDDVPVATRTLKLDVIAGVRLALSRKTARKGQSVRLRGTVLGRPMPSIGKVVELQARNPGKKWITFRTVRSNRAGRFSATYRFRNAGPATFQMRARARRSGDYPYATGSSPSRRIAVR